MSKSQTYSETEEEHGQKAEGWRGWGRSGQQRPKLSELQGQREKRHQTVIQKGEEKGQRRGWHNNAQVRSEKSQRSKHIYTYTHREVEGERCKGMCPERKVGIQKHA